MKTKILYLAALFITCLSVTSCSTKNDPTPTPTTYKFVVNGRTYTQTTGVDSTLTNTDTGVKYNTLTVQGQSADKTASAGLVIFFQGAAKPKAGTYTIVSDASSLATNQVGILVIDKVSKAINGVYGTTGTDGATLKVAVGSSGKISVTMSNMAIKGSNIDNTDPNNSKVTDVTGSISGTAGE